MSKIKKEAIAKKVITKEVKVEEIKIPKYLPKIYQGLEETEEVKVEEEPVIEETENIVSIEDLKKQEELEDLKYKKKQDQNKRIWYSCEMKGHFGMMIPARYIAREGVEEKLICPVCGKQLKCTSKDIELAANK